MKQLFCQLLIVLLLILSQGYCTGESPSLSWGYIVHSDKLTEDYLQSTFKSYSVVSITGFVLNETGTLSVPTGATYESVRTLSRKTKISMYPLITFKSPATGRRILSSEELRVAAARNIAVCAANNGFHGIHLDFEYLPPGDAPRLGLFLDELRRAYHGTVTMAVFPPVDYPEKWRAFHDLSIISSRVDQIVIMCYDLHGAHTGPGPVTDAAWAEKNIRYAMDYFDANKIWLGMPAYGYRWCEGRAVAVSARQGMNQAETRTSYRDGSGNLCYKKGTSCITCISDKLMRGKLQALARRYHLAGTAVWRVGFED
jgi:spore germination protein YaaH